MKQLFKMFLLLFCVFFSITLVAQPTNTAVGDVVMPAPNAASLGKYGDIPVSHYTGVPNIGIPIHTVSERSLSLPISLNYHASGIKVAETASWVGAGWSLNAGGMITRTVLGLPDDKGNGYYDSGISLNSGDFNPILPVGDGAIDGEADIFSFNFGGYSGKFTLNHFKEFQFMPEQDLKIEFERGSTLPDVYNDVGFRQFTITTPDGTRYHFGNLPGGVSDKGLETTTHGYIDNVSGDPITYISSWYLVRIESQSKMDQIDFEYQNQNYSYQNLASCSNRLSYCKNNDGTQSDGNTTCGGILDQTINKYLLKTQVAGKVLSKITTTKETIEFRSETLREDLDIFNWVNTNYTEARSLDEIKITTGPFCEKWIFAYDYFVDPSEDRSEWRRLKLDQVHQESCEGLKIPAYVFTYEGNNFLPNRLSKEIDHWGFYNGADGNETNIATGLNIPLTELGGFQIGNADRETNPEAMKMGVLKNIRYPTGGTTDFNFEANGYHTTRIIKDPMIVPPLENCPNLDGSCCCEDPGEPLCFTEGSTTINISTQQVENGVFKFELWYSDPNPCGTSFGAAGKIIAYQNGSEVGQVNFDLAKDGYRKITGSISDPIDGFSITNPGQYT